MASSSVGREKGGIFGGEEFILNIFLSFVIIVSSIIQGCPPMAIPLPPRLRTRKTWATVSMKWKGFWSNEFYVAVEWNIKLK
jgi:hypothetical protein